MEMVCRMRYLVSLAALALAGAAGAATKTTTFSVTAKMLPRCTVAATNINFGNYTPGSGQRTGNSLIRIRCTRTTPYAVALNAGSNGTLAQRQMKWGSGLLDYNLYTTNTFATIFGDGSGGTATRNGVGLGLGGALQAYLAYGRLQDSAANQNAQPNNGASTYTDTVTVTVTY